MFEQHTRSLAISGERVQNKLFEKYGS